MSKLGDMKDWTIILVAFLVVFVVWLRGALESVSKLVLDVLAIVVFALLLYLGVRVIIKFFGKKG